MQKFKVQKVWSYKKKKNQIFYLQGTDNLINCVCVCVCVYTILPKVLGRPLLMNRFDYFSNFYEYKS